MEIEKIPAAGVLGSFNQLELLVREAPYAVAVFDREMRYLLANARWVSDYGLTGKTIIGQCHYDVLPDLPETWKAYLRQALAGETLGETLTNTDANGNQQQTTWKIFPWFEANDPTPAGIVIMTSNVVYATSLATEREAESLQQARDARYQMETISSLNSALSIATNEEEILAAIAGYAMVRGAKAMLLSYAEEVDTRGEVTTNRVVAAWAGDGLDFANPMLNRRMTPQDFPFIKLLYHDPNRLMYIENPATDPQLDDQVRALILQRGIASTVLIPFYSKAAGRWQGSITVSWLQPHTFTDEEKAIFNSIGQTASAVVSSRRAYLEVRELAATLEQQVQQRTEELHQSQRLMRQVIDGVPALIFAKDRESRYTLANKALADVHGVSTEKLVGMGLDELGIKPEEKDAFLAADRRVIDSRQAVYIAEEPLTGADGKTRWMQTTKLPIVNDDGTCTNLLGIAVDITDLKKANQAIREANQRFDLAIQGAQLGLWEWDLVTNDAIFSERWASMFGYKVEEIEPTFNGFGRLVHPDDMPKTSKVINQYLTGKIPNFDVEFRAKTKDGEWKWALSSGKVMNFDADGKPTRMVGILQDIDARKRSEQAIQAANLKFEVAIQGAQLGLWDWNITTNELVLSERWCEMLGYRVDEVEESVVGFTSLLHPDDRPRMLTAQQHYMSGEAPNYNIEVRMKAKDGSWKHIFTAAKLMGDGTPENPKHLIGVNQDITERKQAEQAIHEANDKFEVAMQGAELGLWEWNLGTNYMSFSDRLVAMLDYMPGDIQPHIDGFTGLIHPDDLPRTTKIMDQYINGEITGNKLQFRMRTKKDEWKWVTSSGKALERTADGKAIRMVGILEDINAQKVSERERERLIRQLREASRYKDEFFAVMSHELRTPLNAMIGLLGIVLMKGKIAPDDATMITRARANSDRLLTLINNILDISRMEAGRLQLTPTDINLRKLVDRLHATMGVLAEQKHVEFNIHIDENVPETLHIDEDATIKVISNLLGNAFKFTESGSVSLTITPQGNNIAVEVKDTGAGIPAHMHEIIFESFRQVDASSTRVHGGSGLGLSIVRNLCQAMGGSIRLESEPGKGSTFTAILPMRLEKVS